MDDRQHTHYLHGVRQQGDQRRQEQVEVEQAGRRAAEVLEPQAAQVLLAQVGEAKRQQREQPAVEQEPPVAEGVPDLLLASLPAGEKKGGEPR